MGDLETEIETGREEGADENVDHDKDTIPLRVVVQGRLIMLCHIHDILHDIDILDSVDLEQC